jgi:hypothetical protein
MATEFTISGIEYKQDPLDTMKQFYLCLEAAPLCVSLDDNPVSMVLALSQMKREKLQELIDLVMPVVKRKDHGVFTQVYTHGAFMFPDISAAAIIQIIAAVIGEYLPDFFSDLDVPVSNTR